MDSLAEAFREGGWGMYPIALIAVFAIAIGAERISYLYFKARINKADFVNTMHKYLFQGNLQRAITYCSSNRAPLANIIKAGLLRIDGTEAASGSGEVYPRQATVIVRDASSYAGIRVSIDAQSTPDGYFEVGSFLAGPVVVFGTDYSWGRILEQSWNVELNQARGGQRMPYEAGPARRSVEVAWTDGIDVTQIDGNDSDADYMLSTSTGGIEPVAYTRDVLYTVQGTVEALGGPLRPVVYLPAVGKGTPDSETLTGRSAAVYGRITSPIRLESILGDENSDEVWRLARLTIEEEV